jgi:predicted ribosome quality control (RQC) complex YloA/Tae2 family protein
MEIEIDFLKSIEDNATRCFKESKLARRKIEGLKKAIIATTKNPSVKKETQKNSSERKKKWFEKYHWFYTSDGLLVVGGKDAHSNEEIVKKHMDKKDVYFHAEIYGAPHCVIKFSESKLKNVPDSSMQEAAQFAVTFSKAFEQGMASADAYSVSPEQVSKRAPSGESMGVGAFMIYGERNWFKKTPVSFAIGYIGQEKILMSGPVSAVKKRCVHVFELKNGNMEKNEIARLLQSKYKEKGLIFNNEEILSLLPNGKFSLK